MTELDERKESVLRAVVEEYIATAEPVGSARVAKTRNLGVSSATVRNDMAALERDGYLVQPHTSAGRIPTDEGYRYFVDHLGRVEALGPPYAATVSEFFQQAQTALEDVFHETSRLLARITDQAALVVGPQPESARVLSVQLVRLQADTLLAVLVLSNGVVEKVPVRLEAGVDDETLERSTEALVDDVQGRTLIDLGVIGSTGDRAADELASTVVSRLRELGETGSSSEPVFVGGTSNIAAEFSDFSATETVSSLLEVLEQQVLVVTLARSLLDRGITVRIGAENEHVELQECSVILAPVTLGEQVAGTVGVLGPTRMDYARAMAAVATVSKSLAEHLVS